MVRWMAITMAMATEDMQTSGAAYWDGYGINSGRSMDNGANYTTYGTRNDSIGTTLGQDLRTHGMT